MENEELMAWFFMDVKGLRYLMQWEVARQNAFDSQVCAWRLENSRREVPAERFMNHGGEQIRIENRDKNKVMFL